MMECSKRKSGRCNAMSGKSEEESEYGTCKDGTCRLHRHKRSPGKQLRQSSAPIMGAPSSLPPEILEKYTGKKDAPQKEHEPQPEQDKMNTAALSELPVQKKHRKRTPKTMPTPEPKKTAEPPAESPSKPMHSVAPFNGPMGNTQMKQRTRVNPFQQAIPPAPIDEPPQSYPETAHKNPAPAPAPAPEPVRREAKFEQVQKPVQDPNRVTVKRRVWTPWDEEEEQKAKKLLQQSRGKGGVLV